MRWLNFRKVLEIDRDNQPALLGAGEEAFQLGRYRTAEGYLQTALRADPQNPQSSQLLKSATLVLQGDPSAPRISDAERYKRLRVAFKTAGERLDDCAKSKSIDLSPTSPSVGLPALNTQWLTMAPELTRLRPPRDGPSLDAVMDLVFEIERQTEATCGTPDGVDQALLLLSQDRGEVER
jgi:tetratricopeptide (TPR) repeat protein